MSVNPRKGKERRDGKKGRPRAKFEEAPRKRNTVTGGQLEWICSPITMVWKKGGGLDTAKKGRVSG